jgi:hypothetical protein
MRKTMLKKILLAALFVGLIGVLVTGAVIRTMDKTEQVAEARGYGRGDGEAGATEAGGAGQGRGGYGQASGTGRAAGRGVTSVEALPEEWLEYEGSVVQTQEAGADLVIQTPDGEELTVGTGPDYMASQDFALQAGELVQVRGYWQDGEFKAAQVTRLADGQAIALRDEFGRPAWAGAGRNAQSGGQGREDAPGEQSGTGQAQVEAWLTVQGAVVEVGADALVVQAVGGEQVAVENRAWWFAQEGGFSAQVGDEVTLVGFYEGDDFEVGRIDDVTTGQTVLVRDENGRPLWAGRGRRGA